MIILIDNGVTVILQKKFLWKKFFFQLDLKISKNTEILRKFWKSEKKNYFLDFMEEFFFFGFLFFFSFKFSKIFFTAYIFQWNTPMYENFFSSFKIFFKIFMKAFEFQYDVNVIEKIKF